jgi:hypothetical protein
VHVRKAWKQEDNLCSKYRAHSTMSNRFTSFHLYEMHKLITVFQFMSQFSLIQAPSSSKPIVVPCASSRKLIFVLRVFASRAVLEEWIKVVNRGITVISKACQEA